MSDFNLRDLDLDALRTGLDVQSLSVYTETSTYEKNMITLTQRRHTTGHNVWLLNQNLSINTADNHFSFQ